MKVLLLIATSHINRCWLKLSVSADEAIKVLGVNRESEDDPHFIHLATEVSDRGWPEIFMYSSVYNYVPDETQKILVDAVLCWIVANFPDTYYANVLP